MTVPIAAQATSSHILHVIRNSLLTIMVIDETHLGFVLQLVEGTSVKHIIVMGDDVQEREYFGIQIHGLHYLKQLGQLETIEKSDQISKSSVKPNKDKFSILVNSFGFNSKYLLYQ